MTKRWLGILVLKYYDTWYVGRNSFKILCCTTAMQWTSISKKHCKECKPFTDKYFTLENYYVVYLCYHTLWQIITSSNKSRNHAPYQSFIADSISKNTVKNAKHLRTNTLYWKIFMLLPLRAYFVTNNHIFQ